MGTKNSTIKMIALIAMTIMVLSSGIGAYASNQESKWHVRVRGLVVDGDQEFSVDDGESGKVLAGGDAALGMGVAIEYRATRWFGFELAHAYAKVPDLDYEYDNDNDDISDIGEGPAFVPGMASLLFHLTPEQPFDLYLGPTIALVHYGDFELELEDGDREFEGNDDFAWGGTLGVDIPFGDTAWGFNAAVTYLTSDMEIREVGSDEVTTIAHDPLMVQVGVSFSF